MNAMNTNSKKNTMETIKMTRSQFVQYLINEVNGSQFIGVTTRIPVEMRKGRSKANRNPYYGRVEIVKTRSLNFGWRGYEQNINARLEREGLDPNFKTEAMNGRRWLCYNKVEQNRYNESVLYVRFYTPKDNPFTYHYLVDGQDATPQQIEEFTPWIVEKAEDYSYKQSECGLSEEEMLFPRCPKVDNIVSVRIKHTNIVLE